MRREALRKLRAAMRPTAAVMLVGLTLSGCQVLQTADGDSTLRPSGSPVTVDTLTRNDRLASIAREQHPRILATYGGEYANPTVERMVARIVGSLTLDPDNPNQTYQITILNSPNINAFALPGGYLYVTRGLLALANDSAELAAVLAHEMAHVTANHGIQRQQREAEEQLLRKWSAMFWAARPLAGWRSFAVSCGWRSSPAIRSSKPMPSASAPLAGAGYDPYAAVRFLQSMATYAELRSVNANTGSAPRLSRHPSQSAAAHRTGRGAMPASSDRPAPARGTAIIFLAGLDGMLFGDTPEEGFVRGRIVPAPCSGRGFHGSRRLRQSTTRRPR